MVILTSLLIVATSDVGHLKFARCARSMFEKFRGRGITCVCVPRPQDYFTDIYIYLLIIEKKKKKKQQRVRIIIIGSYAKRGNVEFTMGFFPITININT